MEFFDAKRPVVSAAALESALDLLKEWTQAVIRKHGPGMFVSAHEMFGIITEEYDELERAINENDIDAVIRESLDVAQVALFFIACVEEGKFRRRRHARCAK